MTQKTTISPEEIEKFNKMAEEWWDPKGKFKPLHLFNPTRIAYIKEVILAHFKCDSLTGLSLLDIGCGGGLLAEPMTRLGAKVTAIDASEKNIKTALSHAEKMGLSIDYHVQTAEDLAKTKDQTFDIILNMEVIEHVASPEFLIESCQKLLKPNGLLFIATLNRTLKSYGLAILGAEYILRWLPIGTHDWNCFLKPEEIQKMTQNVGLTHQEWEGVSFNPFTQKWSRTADLSVNYMGYFINA